MSQSPPDRIESILEQVAHQQAANTEALAQLSVENKRLATKCKAMIENAKTDREAFQVESRRVWEYLLRQSGNADR